MHHNDGEEFRAGNHAKKLPPRPSSGATAWGNPDKPRRAKRPQAVERSWKLPVGCGHHPAQPGSARGERHPITHHTSSEAPAARGPPDLDLVCPHPAELRAGAIPAVFFTAAEPGCRPKGLNRTLRQSCNRCSRKPPPRCRKHLGAATAPGYGWASPNQSGSRSDEQFFNNPVNPAGFQAAKSRADSAVFRGPRVSFAVAAGPTGCSPSAKPDLASGRNPYLFC